MNDGEFNLKVVLEGLFLVNASPEERAAYFADPQSLLDENFDFAVLDFLNHAVRTGYVPKDVATEVEGLITEADQFLQLMNHKQEDTFLDTNPVLAQKWRTRATRCIKLIVAHNSGMQLDLQKRCALSSATDAERYAVTKIAT